MTTVSERSARMALSAIADAGDPRISRVITQIGAQAAWNKILEGVLGDGLARRAAARDVTELAAVARRARTRFVVPGDPEWPARLDDLAQCEPINQRGGVPAGLWVRGPADLAERLHRCVAVVGARACTEYGRSTAVELSADLAERGVTVISGGAFGIDAAAHRGALGGRGATLAVLACGTDVSYPPANSGLLERIAQEHVVVSELPPGEHPTRMRFLARNRLIAALSQGVVVVEAGIRSGARSTAGWASACQRPVMAVPGPIDSATSQGPHQMVRSGQATLVCSADDILELTMPIGEVVPLVPHGPERPTDRMDFQRLSVYEALPRRTYLAPGELALKAGVSIPVCLSELCALEESGLAEAGARGWRARWPA